MIILLCGVYLFLGSSVARLGQRDVNNPNPRSYKNLVEAKFRPINPPVDVMVNPLHKPLPEGDLCATE